MTQPPHELDGLYAELDELAPPLATDADAMTARGRRRVRTRRMRGYGGLAAFAAVTVGAAYVLGGLVRPAEPVQPTYALPELDPAAYDYWTFTYDGSPTETPETVRLTNGVWNAVHTVPGLEYTSDEWLTGWDGKSREGMPPLWRAVNQLALNGDPDHIVYSAPFYGTFAAPDRTYLRRSGAAPLGGIDTPAVEFDVRLLPKGGYLGANPSADAARPLSLLTWGPYTQPVCADAERPDGTSFTYECSETTGPDGRRVLRAVQLITEEYTSSVEQTVVVYQSNGDALTLHTTVRWALGLDYESGAVKPLSPQDVANAKAYLTIDELTSIALAIPEVIVV